MEVGAKELYERYLEWEKEHSHPIGFDKVIELCSTVESRKFGPVDWIPATSGFSGKSSEATEILALDALQIVMANELGAIEIATPNLDVFASQMVKVPTSKSNAESSIASLSRVLKGDIKIKSHMERADVDLNEDEEEPDKETQESEEKPKESKQDPNEKKDPPPVTRRKLTELQTKIAEFYYSYYAGIVENLKKRYTAMYASGYEVTIPAGLLTSEGIVGLSGNERKVKHFNTVTMNMYNIFKSRMNFVESAYRSDKSLGNAIYKGYREKINYYFPNKFLEFAFGRTPTNGDSDHTYGKHANSSSWERYCESAVGERISQTLANLSIEFVENTVGEGQEDSAYFNMEVGNALADFLKYAEACLSTSILIVDYKSRKKELREKVSTIKIRICDPYNTLGDHNYIEDVIQQAFLGDSGSVPFSYEPRLETDVFVKEYAHDFNRDEALAMPLFAYKALEKLQEQGQSLSWSSIILGMYSDGSILRNGTHGIDLNKEITHHIIAGSRAGKGVMTLAILASAVASGKPTFYFDNKPDMASLFRSLCSQMFVVNGDKLSTTDDKYNQFPQERMDALLKSMPGYALKAFNSDGSWGSMGAQVYVRALMLVVGIISARASMGTPDDRLGGKNGIVVVVDEFNELQTAFQSALMQLLENIPPHMSVYDKEKSAYNSSSRKVETKQSQGKDCFTEIEAQETAKANIDKLYGEVPCYALAYAKSLANSISYIDRKRNAGFAEAENGMSDIFVISQDLGYTSTAATEFKTSLDTDSGRYKRNQLGYKYDDKLDLKRYGSVPFNLIDLKRMDAFFGRNGDKRADFLAQRTKGSKAFGRLDDKASNFAYLDVYNQSTAKKIAIQNISENLEIAGRCKYFKPFLILNDGETLGQYVQGVFQRCENNGVTKDQILAENPGPTPSDINPCVGFVDYLKMAGCSNVQGVLKQSGDIANYVVGAMGYTGGWEDFICDFSAKWIFSVEDVVNACMGKPMPMSNPTTNPVTEESAKYCPRLFGLEEKEESIDSDDFEDGVLSDADYEDISCTIHEVRQDVQFKSVFEETETLDEEEELDLFDDEEDFSQEDSEEDAEDDYYEPIEESEISETLEEINESPIEESFRNSTTESPTENHREPRTSEVLENMKVKDSEKSDLEMLMSLLKKFNMNLNVGENGWEVTADPPKSDMYPNGYTGNHSRKTRFNQKIEYRGDVETLSDLIRIISTDIVEMFGGYDNIVSFKVIGGSIIVNGYYYKCDADQMFVRELPYDVRRQIQNGNISRLFDYGLLLRCKRLRDLEFDSRNFVYDYVSPALGYGSNVSIDRFFNTFTTLQVFTLGKKKFRRATYMEDIRGNDDFYHPRKVTRIADASENLLKNAGASSWNFSKKMVKSNDYGKAVKTIGVIAGLGGATVTMVAFGSSKVGRGAFNGVKKLYSNLKDAVKETRDLQN